MDATRARPSWLRYAVAVISVAVALGLKLLLVPILSEDEPFLLFFAAILVTAVFGGLGPGLLATTIASLIDNYFFVEPYFQFGFSRTDQQGRLVLFIVEGVFISIICARLQAARRRAESSAAEARELEARILEMDEQEQRRIGHDLHDGLGQQLTGIALMARRLEQRLAAAQSSESADAAKLSELTKSAVAVAHDLCRTLAPSALESGGLAEALRELAANAETIFGIEVPFVLEGDAVAVDVSAGTHLYRIAQEAISNAVRHGKARRVQLLLEGVGTELILRIRDDGSGIAPPGERRAAGMGLRIMNYRARMIGANVEIRPMESGGTEVVCRYHATPDEPNGSN
jgi:signal transduction histidine kinase